MTLRCVPCLAFARRLFFGVWLASAPMAVAGAAGAQVSDVDIARAREQFRQGIGLEAAGDWAGALIQFEAVARVKMTPQVRFHIARCQHKLGKLLEALGGYRFAAHEAAQDAKAAETLTEARKGIKEVETRIPKLVIERGIGAEAASVTLDGVSLGDSSIGKGVPVNPGVHTIKFTVPDGNTSQRVVRIKEGDTKRVTLTVSLDKAQTNTSAPVVTSTESSSSVLPWVAMGVGGASLVSSGVLYFMRADTLSDHDDQCVNNVCPTSLKDTGDKGKTYAMLGNVTLGIGLIGLGVGTVMLLTDGDTPSNSEAEMARKKPPTSHLSIVVGGSDNGAEANLVGTF